MGEKCYACDEPARYTCDARTCHHSMCARHAVIRMLGSVEPVTVGDRGEEGADSLPPDHEHLCLEHTHLG